jgi:hypothetical protein
MKFTGVGSSTPKRLFIGCPLARPALSGPPIRVARLVNADGNICSAEC